MTKIYMNLAEVDLAQHASTLDVDGVGLMRAEFIMYGYWRSSKLMN